MRNLTLEMIKEQMHLLCKNYKGDANRDIVMYTGIAGMTAFTKSMDLHNNCDFASFLKDKGKITEDECTRLIQMMTSPDEENYTVAVAILSVKSKELKPNDYERNI